ncbi:hypothetical protein IFT92_18365 [Peribacillus simplex]|uniref:hypothetical protein n=1 Tax=Peribacillus simplex TaxID=1478 RepID=UPI0019227895|nr:hypothetical protein [Peribacillus simplex]MBD8589759.1 hypothetical protein [Peribacillus simplex]
MEEVIENEFKKYNQFKMDLLKMSQCLECCDESQKELYQNICLEYSKELKKIQTSIERTYGIIVCNNCER